MNTTPTDEVVLKQDVLGRVKTPKARREQLLDEFERSGLPGLKFAELAGIKYPTVNDIYFSPLATTIIPRGYKLLDVVLRVCAGWWCGARRA